MVANENYMATCPKGLEHVLGLELTELKAEGVQESVAGCYFSADLATAYRICLWSRLANRVLLLLARTRVDSDESLYQTAFGLPWGDYFSPDKTLLIDFNGTSSFIRDSRFGALRIKDAINDHFVNAGHTRLTIDDEKPDVLVYARLFNGRFSIGLDLVGESLHKRGYRSSGGAAPLKENLAAAILNQSDWPAIASEGGSFVDPMCGSGTLLIEAALMAANIPPTFLRTRGLVGNGLWTLTQLMTFNHDLWQAALAQQEREFISTRTKAALAAAKTRGVKLGGARPNNDARHAAVKVLADQNASKVSKFIKDNRASGRSYRYIAEQLNQLSVSTAKGGNWFASTVRNYDLRVS